ncbi:hypothetical protein HOY80DRAFT_1137840 [Tuber brumale]|nr:hypothetical protein HOY80DRAFT_1137840 [Tuber brumale]
MHRDLECTTSLKVAAGDGRAPQMTQVSSTGQQRKRALKWKARCKRAKQAKASALKERNNLKLNENKQYLSSMVSIIAAVIFQALYAKVPVGPSRNSHEKRVVWIRNFQEKFWEFVFEKAEEVDSLADLWVGIMKSRNTAAHQVNGQDVIDILPHCEAPLRKVLEQSFKFLWGIPVNNWGSANLDQKLLSFRY